MKINVHYFDCCLSIFIIFFFFLVPAATGGYVYDPASNTYYQLPGTVLGRLQKVV